MQCEQRAENARSPDAVRRLEDFAYTQRVRERTRDYRIRTRPRPAEFRIMSSRGLPFAAVVDEHRFLQQLNFLRVMSIDIGDQRAQIIANLLEARFFPFFDF